jgi:hypothetical protein
MAGEGRRLSDKITNARARACEGGKLDVALTVEDSTAASYFLVGLRKSRDSHRRRGGSSGR